MSTEVKSHIVLLVKYLITRHILSIVCYTNSIGIIIVDLWVHVEWVIYLLIFIILIYSFIIIFVTYVQENFQDNMLEK